MRISKSGPKYSHVCLRWHNFLDLFCTNLILKKSIGHSREFHFLFIIHLSLSKIDLEIWAMLGSACNWESFCGYSVCASFYGPGLFAPFHKMDMDVHYLCHDLSNVLSSCLTPSVFCHSSHTCTHHPLPWLCRHWWVALKAKEQYEYNI